MFYIAKRYSAPSTLELGWVNKVVTLNDIESTLVQWVEQIWVEQICINAPLTQAAFKACVGNFLIESMVSND